jgi:putative membrane protein
VGSRFPHSVFGRGREPDPRFTLANERTLLAWLRTSLALLAGGVALEAFGLPMQSGLRLAASLTLVVTALLLPVLAWRSWAGTERALREGNPLPSSPATLPLSVALVLAGCLTVAALVLH